MKVLMGKVISIKMKNTVVVDVMRVKTHPVYKKRMRRNKNVLADTGAVPFALGDRVKIVETRPISKNKHFKVLEVIKNDSK